MPFDFSRWSLTTLFHYKSKVKGEPVTEHRVTNPYHAVAIVPTSRACQAARDCANKRFLSSEAPLLPLEGCDAGECRCRYQHFSDRRDASRRAADVAVVNMSGMWTGVERRRGGRRFDD